MINIGRRQKGNYNDIVTFVDQYMKLYDAMKRIDLDMKTENNGNRIIIYCQSRSKKSQIPVAIIHLNEEMDKGVIFDFNYCLYRYMNRNNRYNKNRKWQYKIQAIVDKGRVNRKIYPTFVKCEFL